MMKFTNCSFYQTKFNPLWRTRMNTPSFCDFYLFPLLLLLLLSRFSRVRLRDAIDGSPQGSPVPGILQARVLEWVAISFSNVWKWKVKEKSLSRVRLLATPWTAAYQAPPSTGFSRQEYWSGVPLPSPIFFRYLLRFFISSSSPPLTRGLGAWHRLDPLPKLPTYVMLQRMEVQFAKPDIICYSYCKLCNDHDAT